MDDFFQTAAGIRTCRMNILAIHPRDATIGKPNAFKKDKSPNKKGEAVMKGEQGMNLESEKPASVALDLEIEELEPIVAPTNSCQFERNASRRP